jgi:hypothetical protein
MRAFGGRKRSWLRIGNCVDSGGVTHFALGDSRPIDWGCGVAGARRSSLAGNGPVRALVTTGARAYEEHPRSDRGAVLARAPRRSGERARKFGGGGRDPARSDGRLTGTLAAIVWACSSSASSCSA